MPLASTQYSGDGSNRNFNVTFPYISQDHIVVTVDGVSVTFIWLTASTVQTTVAPGSGTVVQVKRATPNTTLLVDFVDGSTLVESDLDLLARQCFYLAQESFDQTGGTLSILADGTYSAGGRRIASIANPVDAQDSVTKSWAETGMTSQLAQATTQASASASSAAAALASQGAAATSASGASTSATTATTKAGEAVVSAAAALASEGAAATSASAAASSASAAATSASNAATSYDSFDDRYLGAKATAPTLDNDGAALLVGALYWDTVLSALRAWDGAQWNSIQPGISQTDGDLRYARLSGAILTGFLTLHADPTANLHAATKQYADGKSFPTGTLMMFVQTSAPVGWTKSTTHNNKALRVVSGTATSGGTVDFSTAFASRGLSGSVGNHTLTIAQMPWHGHSASGDSSSNAAFANRANLFLYPTVTSSGNYIGYGSIAVNGEGGGGAHNHTLTLNNLDMAVAYVDVIIASKD